VFWFSPQRLSEIFLILRIIQRDTIKNVHWSSYKVPNIFDTFKDNEFSRKIFEKNTQIPNLMKIRLVMAELNHADWRSDRRTDRQGRLWNPKVHYRAYNTSSQSTSKNASHSTSLWDGGVAPLILNLGTRWRLTVRSL